MPDLSGQVFIVERLNPRRSGEIKKLVGKKRYSRAIVTALSGGGFVKGIRPEELHCVKANLVITKESAHWDLSQSE
jgi:hypothetical protein